jgi:hypothetical protein
MIKPISIVLVAAVALVAIASGCGDSDSAASATPLTKAQFIKQGDAICVKSDKAQVNAYLDYANDNPKKAETKKGQREVVVLAGLPPLKTAIEELGELGVPKGDEAQVEAIVGGMEKALEEAEADPSKVYESAVTTPFDKTDALARKYGFVACGDAL